jgi:uncharacterized protein YjiK
MKAMKTLKRFAAPCMRSALFAGALFTGALSASGNAFAALNLGSYTLTGTYALPAVSAAEASAITWNRDTDTLFVLGDEGDALVEVSKTGAQLGVMSLSNFADTEGLTYIGGGQFVMTEERLRDAFRITYTAGGSASSTSLASANLGTTVTNIGIEGISWDPRDGSFVTVKEKAPQEVNRNVITFGTVGGAQGTAVTTSLFTPALGVADLADVQVLATVQSLAGSADADNLLVLSQESATLMEITRSGAILSTLYLGNLSGNLEGVTIDANGVIYLAVEASIALGDTSTLFVLTPTEVPVPAALPLLGSALAGLAALRRRKRV